jgi:hypothetical protein
MKTTAFRRAMSLAVLLLAVPAFASATGDPVPDYIHSNSATLEREVMHQIDRYVIYPVGDRTDAMLGVVEVTYVVNTEGRLVVTSAGSANRALRDYVLEKLSRVQISPNPSGLWKPSNVRFTFRAE